MHFRVLIAFALSLIVGCGGGGGSDGLSQESPPAEFGITTEALDAGNVGKSFLQVMQAAGGTGTYTWWVSSSGDPLPAGLAMQPDGRLAGTPQEATAASVVVVCQDADGTLDLETLRLEVRDLAISGASRESLATGEQLQLQASGGNPGYTFSFTSNTSGASLSQTGSYTAGSEFGVDIIRATDTDGFYEEVSVTVGTNPFVGFKAEWGTTDVWYINFDVLYDPTPTFANDFDEVLASLGLRDPASTETSGTEADTLARLLVMRRVYAHISTYFGNSPDGGLLPGGAAISFPALSPPEGGATPAPGATQAPAPFLYNTMCLRWGPSSNVVGTAWLDPNNDSIEHDCGTPQGTALGVFPNRILGPYLAAFNNAITDSPVAASDVEGLRAMLQGAAPQGSRETDIWNVADQFARVLAAVLAHEIGHSLGLGHSGGTAQPPSHGQGDIMNAALSVNPSVTYTFNAGHWATLLTDLPGPNR